MRACSTCSGAEAPPGQRQAVGSRTRPVLTRTPVNPKMTVSGDRCAPPNRSRTGRGVAAAAAGPSRRGDAARRPPRAGSSTPSRHERQLRGRGGEQLGVQEHVLHVVVPRHHVVVDRRRVEDRGAIVHEPIRVGEELFRQRVELAIDRTRDGLWRHRLLTRRRWDWSARDGFARPRRSPRAGTRMCPGCRLADDLLQQRRVVEDEVAQRAAADGGRRWNMMPVGPRLLGHLRGVRLAPLLEGLERAPAPAARRARRSARARRPGSSRPRSTCRRRRRRRARWGGRRRRASVTRPLRPLLQRLAVADLPALEMLARGLLDQGAAAAPAKPRPRVQRELVQVPVNGDRGIERLEHPPLIARLCPRGGSRSSCPAWCGRARRP